MSTTTLPTYAVHPISSVPMIVIADVSHTLNRLTHLSKTKRMSDVRLDAVVDLLLQLADRPNEWYPEFGGIIMHPDLATRLISLKDVMHIAHTFGNKAQGRKKVPVDAFIDVIIMLADRPKPEGTTPMSSNPYERSTHTARPTFTPPLTLHYIIANAHSTPFYQRILAALKDTERHLVKYRGELYQITVNLNGFSDLLSITGGKLINDVPDEDVLIVPELLDIAPEPVPDPTPSLPLPAGMIIIEQDHDDHMHTLIGFMRESAQGNYVAFWAYVSEPDLWAGQRGGNANLCITTYDPANIRVARDQSAAGLPEELALARHPRLGTVLVTRATNDIGDHLVLTTFKGNAAQTYAKPGEFLFLS